MQARLLLSGGGGNDDDAAATTTTAAKARRAVSRLQTAPCAALSVFLPLDSRRRWVPPRSCNCRLQALRSTHSAHPSAFTHVLTEMRRP
jgi:hypothetical protein